MTEMADRESLLAGRFAALSTHERGDWADVRRRSGMRRTRTLWALSLAAALAAIVAGSALALYRDEIEFWSSPAAPERIVIDFQTMRRLAVSALGPNVIPGEARRVASFTIAGKSRGLFVAPTEEGGYCWRLHFIGSCGRTGNNDESFGFGFLGSHTGGAAWINGDFLDSDITRIEVEYEDGEIASVPFVWVTAPIDAGFYSLDVPTEHLAVGRRAAFIRAYNESGDEVARRGLSFAEGG
jgi:hypothetical protein